MISCPTLHWQWLVQSGGQIPGDTVSNVCSITQCTSALDHHVPAFSDESFDVAKGKRNTAVAIKHECLASNKGAPSLVLLYLCFDV